MKPTKLLKNFEDFQKGYICKVEIYRDYRNTYDTYITCFHGYNSKLDNADFGHPYSLSLKETFCGEMGARMQDIVSISPVTIEEAELWKKSYEDFHNKIMMSVGYDICTEDYMMFMYEGRSFCPACL